MIETERLILRPWRLTDAADLYKYASEPRVSEPAQWPSHTSEQMSREVIENYFIPNKETFAIELKETGEAIGAIGLVPVSDTNYPLLPAEREVGYWIGVPHWNRGLTTEALKAFVHYCHATLGLSSLLITTLATNKASQSVALKTGFTSIGDFQLGTTPAKAFRLTMQV